MGRFERWTIGLSFGNATIVMIWCEVTFPIHVIPDTKMGKRGIQSTPLQLSPLPFTWGCSHHRYRLSAMTWESTNPTWSSISFIGGRWLPRRECDLLPYVSRNPNLINQHALKIQSSMMVSQRAPAGDNSQVMRSDTELYWYIFCHSPHDSFTNCHTHFHGMFINYCFSSIHIQLPRNEWLMLILTMFESSERAEICYTSTCWYVENHLIEYKRKAEFITRILCDLSTENF